MSVLRRRLLMGRGRGGYVDDFTALSTRWDVQAGTLAVAGGALQATTLGDWRGNQLQNTGFTDNLDYWGKQKANLSRVDSSVDPGTISPGIDKWVLKVITTDDYGQAIQAHYATMVVGQRLRLGGLVYAPSSNIAVNAARIIPNAGGGGVSCTTEDAWEAIETTYNISTTGAVMQLNVNTDAGAGEIAYFDDVYWIRQNAPALLAGWRSPNHVTQLGIVNPATSVIPFGFITRYTDSLNYWEVRVLPNTAGNDLQIIQVTDGAETTRAEADVDWTSDDTDELEVTCAGSTISTAYRKAGAGVWTAGPSYASATQGQTSPQLGVMLYEAGVGRLSGFDVRRA